MTTRLSEDLESTPANENISSSNTALNAISSPSTKAVCSTAQAHSGTRSIKIQVSASTVFLAYEYTSNEAEWFTTFYVRPSAAPSAVVGIAAFYDIGGTNKIGDMRLNADLTLQLRNVSADIGSTTKALSTTGWNRVQYRVRPGATQEAIIFNGANLETTTVETGARVTGSCAGTAAAGVGHFRFGVFSTATLLYYIDDIAISNSAFITPSPPVTSGGLQAAVDGAWADIGVRRAASGVWV